MPKTFFRNIVLKYNPVGALFYLYKQNKELKKEIAIWKVGKWPPGHFYTATVLKDDLPEKEFTDVNQEFQGIDMREPEQLALLNRLSENYRSVDWPAVKQDGTRYYFKNEYFSYSDAVFLELMIRRFKPKRIIEVGSGFSSALMLDINEKYRDLNLQLTFIEPFPEDRLNRLIKVEQGCRLMKDFVQNTKPSVWGQLEADDILFIDSSHISKYGSDVNHIIFNILPALKPGVIIHFHDIVFPFDYPVDWLRQERFWNEAYLLRAFLQFNTDFEILIFPSFLEKKHRSWFEQNMPLCLELHERKFDNGSEEYMNLTGQSIYLRRRIRD